MFKNILRTIVGRLFPGKTVRVDAHELEALQRENAEAGIPTLERKDTDATDLPGSGLNPAVRRRDGRGLNLGPFANTIAGNEIDNLNRRYDESKREEDRRRD
jgi:hypothetical protein